MRLLKKRVRSNVNTNRCKAWGLFDHKTRRTTSKIMRKGIVVREQEQTLALCPVVLGIFEAIARFFFFGVGHFLLDAEGRKEKGRGERGKGGQMNDATLGGYIAKCAVSFKVRCMVQVGCPRKAI
jgi:hypothetical protein